MIQRRIVAKTSWKKVAGKATFAMLALGLVVAAGGVGRTILAAEKPAGSYVVKIENFAFGPATLTVPVGTKVTWVNRDDEPHAVVSTDKKFKSAVLDTNDEYNFTFTTAGTYDYFCSIHPKMTAKVIVQ